MYEPSLFSLIANRLVFSIFKDARSSLVFAIYRLPPLVPACPSMLLPFDRLVCLPVRVCTWKKWSSPCVHEHFNLFFFIRPHSTLRRYIRCTHDIVNWVFSRNATGISRYLRLTGTRCAARSIPSYLDFTERNRNFTLRRKHVRGIYVSGVFMYFIFSYITLLQALFLTRFAYCIPTMKRLKAFTYSNHTVSKKDTITLRTRFFKHTFCIY